MSILDLLAQSCEGPWAHDPGMGGDLDLIRVIKTASQIVKEEGGVFTISSQAYTSMKGGCSTEMRQLFEDQGQSIEDRIRANNGIGALSISVGEVRGIHSRVEGGVPKEPLDVAYTPIPEDAEYGPNPHHCDIFPKLGNPGKTRLHAKSSVAVALDQAAAQKLYNIKHGLT